MKKHHKASQAWQEVANVEAGSAAGGLHITPGSGSTTWFLLSGLSQPTWHQLSERGVDRRTNPLFRTSPARLPEGNGVLPLGCRFWAEARCCGENKMQLSPFKEFIDECFEVFM